MEPPNHPDYERTLSRIEAILERLAEARIDRPPSHFEAVDRALQQYIEEGRKRNAETTDKLNRLRDLMDRQQREKGNAAQG